MLVNISMMFHEDILNGLKVIERTQFCHRNCYLQSSKGHNAKIYIEQLWFLRLNGFQWDNFASPNFRGFV